jgi:hypothetical protein
MEKGSCITWRPLCSAAAVASDLTHAPEADQKMTFQLRKIVEYGSKKDGPNCSCKISFICILRLHQQHSRNFIIFGESSSIFYTLNYFNCTTELLGEFR